MTAPLRRDRGEPASLLKSFVGCGASIGRRKVVLVLAAVAVVAVVFVVGLMVGAGIAPWVGGG
jgi:hypothetical protein